MRRCIGLQIRGYLLYWWCSVFKMQASVDDAYKYGLWAESLECLLLLRWARSSCPMHRRGVLDSLTWLCSFEGTYVCWLFVKHFLRCTWRLMGWGAINVVFGQHPCTAKYCQCLCPEPSVLVHPNFITFLWYAPFDCCKCPWCWVITNWNSRSFESFQESWTAIDEELWLFHLFRICDISLLDELGVLL